MITKQQPLFALLFSLLLFSCGGKQGRVTGEVAIPDSVRYASCFTVAGFEGYTLAEINDPWDTTKVLQRYILVSRESPVPADLPKGTLVRVPITNIAVYSSVHLAIIEELGELDRVIGVCEPQYVNSSSVREMLQSGRIVDLGEATAPNVERIIDINTEVIISSPLQNMAYGAVGKLGIPIVEGVDYKENDPLGRAEWIRFYGLLLGKEALADSLFKVTERRYLELKSLVASVNTRPVVLAEKRYGSTWFVPGGDSFMSKMYADAGADYVFKDIPETGSVALSFETVLDQAISADCWLIKYHDFKDLTYGSLKQEYSPYQHFDAFKKRAIFGSNSSRVLYYEETPLHPDYLLKDLVSIFHPGLLPGHTLRYFHRLEE